MAKGGGRDSDSVLDISELLAEEGALAHTQPELAVHVTFALFVQVGEETLGALFVDLLEVLGQLPLLSERWIRCQQTNLVEDEVCVSNVSRL